MWRWMHQHWTLMWPLVSFGAKNYTADQWPKDSSIFQILKVVVLCAVEKGPERFYVNFDGYKKARTGLGIIFLFSFCFSLSPPWDWPLSLYCPACPVWDSLRLTGGAGAGLGGGAGLWLKLPQCFIILCQSDPTAHIPTTSSISEQWIFYKGIGGWVWVSSLAWTVSWPLSQLCDQGGHLGFLSSRKMIMLGD